MKFGELLNAQLLSEWRAQYFQYEAAKNMLNNYKENAPAQDDDHLSDFAIGFCHFEGVFFEFCQRELTKINTFYLEKLNEARRKFAALKAELDDYFKYEQEVKSFHHHRKSLRLVLAKTKDLHDFKLAFSEFYFTIVLLQSYQQLNQTAFRKILKKHDKILETEDGQSWRTKNVLTADFASTKAVEELAATIEQLVTEKLENNDHKRAMKMLKAAPVGQKRDSPWAIFRIGVLSGYILLLVVLICLLANWFNCQPGRRGCWRHFGSATKNTTLYPANEDQLAQNPDVFWLITLRLYRGVFLVALSLVFFGLNIMGWRRVGINHILLFELDIRSAASSTDLIELGLIIFATAAMVLFSWLMQFYFAWVTVIPVVATRSISLCYHALLVLFLVNPVPIFLYKTRYWILKSLFRIISSPFKPVTFGDYFFAEQLIGILVPILQDLIFVACSSFLSFSPLQIETVSKQRYFLAIQSLIALLPFWFRFAQCIRAYRTSLHCRVLHPQLTNAGKYLLTGILLLLRSSAVGTESSGNLYHISAIILAFLVCSYWFIFDVRFDWKLADFARKGLREQLTFRSPFSYYTCIVVDGLLLLFYWSCQLVVLSKSSADLLTVEIILTAAAFGEVLRRFVWNFVRLECEHVFHPGKVLHTSHSVVSHHHLKPLLNDEMENVDRMMTREDGVNELRLEKRASRNALLS